jgi:hypothetical protein
MSRNRYELRVEGHLDRAHWQRWFGGMRVLVEPDGTTLLSGPVVDQAALHGLLGRIRDLGLTLISLHRVEQKSEEG